MGKLVLVRHGLSEYNKAGLWTGWDNPHLTPEGFEEANRTSTFLKDIHFDKAFTADQIRSEETFEEIRKGLGYDIPVISDKALNERNYGIYTRKNKWDIKKEFGEKEFLKIRRGWDYPIPEGESPKQVSEREIPYFTEHVLPLVKAGKNILFVSSGNAVRVIIKYLEHLTPEQFSDLEVGTGEAIVYTINENGEIDGKEKRAENAQTGKV